MEQALGLIETRGLIGAIAAADAACKAAAVRLQQRQRAGGALVTVILRGEVAAVTAAVKAGAAEARRVGRLVAAHVIPRPDPEQRSVLPKTGKAKGPQLKKGRAKGRRKKS
jgi:ethanolamine utilization protein EutM